MGFLSDQGATIHYEDSKKIIPKVKEDGILQFLHLLKKFKNISTDDQLWGDETEFHVIHLDPVTKKVKISLNQIETIKKINDDAFEGQEEYGSWMIEAVPKNPYNVSCDPEPVRKNLQARREGIQKVLGPNEYLLPLPVFPMLGVGDFFYRNLGSKSPDSVESPGSDVETPSIHRISSNVDQKSCDMSCVQCKEKNLVSRSRFIADTIITKHPRFPTLTHNLRTRRGETTVIKIPLYKDEKTSMEPTDCEPYPGFIYMDAMAFGMGNCCLQQTFATRNYHNARYLTDQLAVISPIVLALSAASPIFKGKLADMDTRWASVAQGVDDRTSDERDPKNPSYIPKSRYDSISFYISSDPAFKEEYNDYAFPVNEEAKDFARKKAVEMGIDLDDMMLNHIGFLFMRDPMVIFEDKINLENDKFTSHFENVQSTNWNSVRFKPPPGFDTKINNWRVELRTAELQSTEEENTAFNMLAVLIVRMIQKYKLNFYIPMSKLHENFEKSQKRDAVLNEKFWFRKCINYDSPDEYIELSIYEFLLGKEGEYKGLMRQLKEYYADCCKCEGDYFSSIYKNYFLEHIIKRASGEKPTPARWQREFVLKHPAYKKDSIVSEEIAYDLVNAIIQVVHHGKKYSDFA